MSSEAQKTGAVNIMWARRIHAGIALSTCCILASGPFFEEFSGKIWRNISPRASPGSRND